MFLRPLKYTLFPYTTLFRSRLVLRVVAPDDLDELAVPRRMRVGGNDAIDRVLLRTDPRRCRRLAFAAGRQVHRDRRSEEHTSELQSRPHLVCRLLLEKKNTY